MPIYRFTDTDYAVIMDSLTTTRETIRREAAKEPIPEDTTEGATPNLDRVIEAFGSWAHPSGCEFLAVTGEEAVLIAGATEWTPRKPG